MSRFSKFWHGRLGRPYRLNIAFEQGNGDQTIVFLHGLAGSGNGWLSAVSELDLSRFRLVSIDLLGFGASSRPDFISYTVDDHAKSVIKTLRRYRRGKPVILVSHSMGGIIAARIAVLQPELVKQLVLFEIPAYADFPAKNLRDIRHRAYKRVFNRIVKNPELTLSAFYHIGRAASSFLNVKLDDKSWIPFERSLVNTIMQDTVYDDIARASCPVDIVYGRYDFIVVTRVMQKLFKDEGRVKFHKFGETHRIGKRTGKQLSKLLS